MDVRKLVAKELTAWVRKESDLKGFELVKDFVLDHQNFGDSGLMTPTFKLKRNEAKKYYLDKLQAMYSGVSSVNV
ncbi:medium-chain fatty acid-CoA ligase faa2 [Polyrhizophydium stewartii]|uniref:Medium-chain fatty acid-CoA ligase faa2 n=1 Tax=Polyrhizophydium stewartii TaxID=2732419 RepID=A0ABR4NH80_9FUNG